MAIASSWLAANFNRPGFEDFRLQRLRHVQRRRPDGRHWRRGRVDRGASQAFQPLLDVRPQPITLEGRRSWSFSEDVATRFMGYGWNVTRVSDANDLEHAGPRLRDVSEHQGPADFDHR